MTNEERERLVEVDQRSKSNTHAIGELKESVKEIQREQTALHEINASIKIMAESITSVKEDVSDMKTDISNTNKEVKEDISSVKDRITIMENASDKTTATTYRKYRDNIIALIIGGIAAYVLATVCPEIFR